MSSSDVLVDDATARRFHLGRLTQSRAFMATAFAFGLGLASIPLLVTDAPPLFDYPNHLARVDAMNRLSQSTLLQANFEMGSILIPNVLSDLLLLVLMQVCEPRTAGSILLFLTFALTLGGWMALSRVVAGRFSVWPLLAAVFLTNEMFFWGFLNYNLGLALLPWGLAAWLALDRAGAIQRTAAGAAFAILIFLAHLVAFGLYAVAIGLLELAWAWRHRREEFIVVARRLAVSACQFIPACVLYWAVSPSRGLPLDIRFDTSAWGKLSPFSRVLSSGNPDMDTPILLLALALVAIALATRIAGFSLRLWLVAAGFTTMVLVLPYAALGSFFLDSRIVISAVFVLIAGLRPRRLDPSATLAVTAAIMLLLGTRSVVIAADWRAQAKASSEVLTALAELPMGSFLVAGSGRPFELGDWTTTRRVKPSEEHTASYAMIDRQGIVPNLFAKPGQNALNFRPSLAAMRPLDRNPILRVFTEVDFRLLASEASAVAAENGRRRAGFSGVFILVFYQPCSAWPGALPVRPFVCGQDFSIMEALPSPPPIDDSTPSFAGRRP